MDVVQLFTETHTTFRRELLGMTLKDLPEEHWRLRPHGLNSIAWLVWHMARVEDSGINRLVFDSPQVLDDAEAHWPDRMCVSLRHHGTTMTSQEVDDLTHEVDIAALLAYSTAVADRTCQLVNDLSPDRLNEFVEPARLRQVLFEEGMLRPQHAWSEPLPYASRPRGGLLMHFAITHNYGHRYDIAVVRGLLTQAS